MNTEGKGIETYQIFLSLMGSTKNTEVLKLQFCNDSVTPNNNIEKLRGDFDIE